MSAVGGQRSTRFVRNVVVLLTSALVLSLAFIFAVVTEPAQAYTPADLSANSEGPEAQITTVMSHNPQKPTYGQQVTYTGTLEFGTIPEELNGDVTLTVSSDFYAPFDGGDPLSKLTWNGYSGAKPTMTESPRVENGVWIYKFKGVKPNTSVTYTNTATVKSKSEIPPGQTIFATMNANFVASPSISFKDAGARFVGDNGTSNACSGVMVFPSQPLEAGAWLADIKIANAQNNGKVEIDTSPYVPEAGAPANANTIKFELNGRDITAEKMQGATYLSPDSSAPIYGAGSPLVQANPNAKWVDSLNWEYDPKTYTGNTWLPKGTVLTVRKHVTFLDCFGGGFASDFNPNRQVLYVAEIGRPVSETNSNAMTSFTMPGEPFVPKPCTNLYWSEDVSSGGGAFGLFTSLDPMKSIRTGFLEKANGKPTSAPDIAISDKFPYHLYYFSDEGSSKYTMYYDYKTKRFVNTGVSNTGSLWSGDDGNSNPDSLGFDKNGILWTFRPGDARGNNKERIATLYKLDVPKLEEKIAAGQTSGLPQWERVLQVDKAVNNRITGRMVYDLVFDEDGNLYGTVTGKDSLDWGRKKAFIFKLSASQIAAGNDIKNELPNAEIKGAYGVYGMAFGNDGNLYIGYYGGSQDLYYASFNQVKTAINSNSSFSVQRVGKITGEYNNPQNIPPNYGGLASCNFGDVTPPPPHGPEFKVQKSVVNPRTGQILPPGTNSMEDRVQVDAQGNATIDFVVVVTNQGNEKGTPPVIRDTVSVPTGFTITDIKVDGVSQGTNRSLNLQAGELAPGSYDPNGPVPSGNSAQVFRISVSVHTDDVSGYLWDSADECSDTNVSDNKGFHNTVAMNDDKDGSDNNHACVPTVTPSPAKLYLYKQIVNIVNSAETRVLAGAQFDNRKVNPEWEDFRRYSQEQEDLKSFNLSAIPVSTAVGAIPTPLSGQVNPRGRNIADKAVGGPVSAGEYNLLESPINDLAGSEYSMVNVECRNQRKQVVLEPTSQKPAKVTVNKGDTIHCIFSNKQQIKAHVVKTATDPAVSPDKNAGNLHIGNPVEPGKDGLFEIKYTIAVTNDSDETGNTGEVRDFYRVPAGMKWKEGAAATVTFVPGSSRTTLNRDGAPGVFSNNSIYLTEAQMTDSNGVLLAKSINNLAPGASGTSKFEVTIPLVADEDIVPGSNPAQTKFQKNATALATCENKNLDGLPYTTTKSGIPNVVSLENENQRYSKIAIKDNVACVPVKNEPKVDIIVHKVDDAGRLELPDAEFIVCERNPNPLPAGDAEKQQALKNAGCTTKLPQLNLTQCNQYPAGSAANTACVNHYGADTVGGTKPNGSAFVANKLKPGKEYWLVETKAPACYGPDKGEKYCASLLPQPMKFKVSADRIITPYDGNGNEVSANPGSNECSPLSDSNCSEENAYKLVDGSFAVYKDVISVRDPRRANLPISGGFGPWPLAIVALLLITLSFGYAYKTSAVATKPIKVRKPR
ncbi:hypothetical protein KRX54_01755 [Actinomycetaceae bacterium TAE3-ERU4]|nr:hypothetical protein [Actinomycetaceae bacterium TAE3-ERU4]